MQNTIRVRKDAAIKAASLQTKTARCHASPPEKTVVVIFYDPAGDKELFRVEMFAALYSAIVRTARKMKITPAQFFAQAIEAKIARTTDKQAATGNREVAL